MPASSPSSAGATGGAPCYHSVSALGINRRDLNATTRAEATLCRTWDEVLAHLQQKHGDGTRAAVFPCGSIQLATKE